MTRTTYDTTIDWDEYWTDADEDDREGASPSERFALDPLLEFLDSRCPPDAFADVGCGAGVVPFAVADRYPHADVVGYDAAEPVVADDGKRARDEGVANLSFEHAVLPAFDPDRTFDVVTCFFTLCYVRDVESALVNLYDAVAPGGYLVVHYNNSLAQSHYRTVAEDPHERLPEDGAFDPDTYAERFQNVIEGESILSYDRIHDILGHWPQSIWSVAEDADPYTAHRYEPVVFVPK